MDSSHTSPSSPSSIPLLYVPPSPPLLSINSPAPTPPPAIHGSPLHAHLRRRLSISAFSFPSIFNRELRKVEFHSIHTVGRRKLPESVVDSHLKPFQHKRVFLQQIKDAITAINKWLHDLEYVCSYVVLNEQTLFKSKILSLICVEPLLDSIELLPVDNDGKPDPDGRIVTRKNTICRALGIKIGDVFAWKAAGIAKLMALHLFTFGDAEVKFIATDKVTLIFKLCERRSRSAEPGAGISSDGRMYGDFTLVDDNFMGRAQRIRLEFQKRLDAPGPAAGFAFEDMRVGAYIPLSFRLRAYRDCNAVMSSENETETDINSSSSSAIRPNLPLRYEKDRDGVLVDIGYRPWQSSTLLFNLTPMFEHVYANGINTAAGSAEPYLQAVLQTGLTHATRKPIDLPRDGHLLRIEHSVGSHLRSPADTNRMFQRVKVKLINYFAIASRSSIAARVIAGFGSDNLPSHEQRALGGHGSVRGFRYGELGRLKSYGTGRIELRVPLGSNGRDQSDDSISGKPSAVQQAEGNAEQSIRQPEKIFENDRDNVKVSSKNIMAPSLLDRLPALVGVLFTDTAFTDVRRPENLGSSLGLGVRVGGVIAIDWISTLDDRPSRVHFSLVDQSM